MKFNAQMAGAIASGSGELLSMGINDYKRMAELPDTEEGVTQENNIADLYSTTASAGSYDELAQMFNNARWANTSMDMWDLTGMSRKEGAASIALGTLAQMGQGAATGTQILPGWGTLIGAGAGMTQGLITNGFGWGARKNKAEQTAGQLAYQGKLANDSAIDIMQNNGMNIGRNMTNTGLLYQSAYGGPLYNDGNGFTNGVRFITEGGTHEQNPLSGVPQGIAQDGIPNLVEEGEAVWNNGDGGYVFSNRLFVPEGDKSELGLSKKKKYTYSEAADKLQEESEERPNDPISKAGLDAMMERLEGSQEELKQKKAAEKFRAAIKKMTPEELAMFMQQTQQPQQAQPMLAMQPMQPMQPVEAEVPMFAKGGHLFPGGGPLSYYEYRLKHPEYTGSEQEYNEDMYEAYGEDFINSSLDLANNPASSWNTSPDSEAGAAEGESNSGASAGQILRAAPIVGNLIGSIASLFDKPHYANIARTEDMIRGIAPIKSIPIGDKLTYRPYDANYIATQLANQGLGARRALQESGAPAGGVFPAVVASNYRNQQAIGDAILKAMQANDAEKERVATFNRGTNQFNSQQAFEAERANQMLALQKAGMFMKTGAMRDEELARTQAQRNAQWTNLFQQTGNYGQDLLAREQVLTAIKAGVFGNLGDNESAYRNPLGIVNYMASAFGGNLNTKKKGGKNA